jgi:hypothetical protein
MQRFAAIRYQKSGDTFASSVAVSLQTHFVDGSNYGMAEGRGGARLCKNHCAIFGTLLPLVRQYLESDGALEAHIEGAIDHTDAASADSIL